MFKPTTIQVGIELPADMVGQRFALLGQVVDQGRVVCFENLVEQCLFGLTAIIKNIAKRIPALKQHAGRASSRSFRAVYLVYRWQG